MVTQDEVEEESENNVEESIMLSPGHWLCKGFR